MNKTYIYIGNNEAIEDDRVVLAQGSPRIKVPFDIAETLKGGQGFNIMSFIDKYNNVYHSHHYHPDTFATMHLEKSLTIKSIRRLFDNNIDDQPEEGSAYLQPTPPEEERNEAIDVLDWVSGWAKEFGIKFPAYTGKELYELFKTRNQ